MLSFASGNMILLFRTGALCRDMVRKMSRYFVLHGYSEYFTAAYVEKTEDVQKDIAAMYERLDEVKLDFTGSQPMEALPIVRVEKNTGEPVTAIDPETGEGISRLREIRTAEFFRVNGKLDQVDVTPYVDANGDAYYAVAHMDGNNMRVVNAKILQ